MPNPWMRRNPLLTLWLSAANTMLGAARGHAAAAIARGQAAMMPKPARAKRKRKTR